MEQRLRDFEQFWSTASSWAWSWPLAGLLILSGLYFTLVSGFLPFRRWRHALDIIRGRYDDARDPGEISHFAALTTALSATLGMGNIAGVAVAIGLGGPGALFWMWMAGLVGMATKYFTCTLAVLYRKEDLRGVPQGGPMYYLEVGLGRWARPLAWLFSLCGMLGCLALFQVNQLAEVIQVEFGAADAGGTGTRGWTGLACMLVVGAVILGGIRRVGEVTRRIVPAMFVLYLVSALWVILSNVGALPGVLVSIFAEAFGLTAAAGGAAGVAVREVMVTGVQRAAFSNEAGVGTAPMAHGAARTREPVREGLIAMLGPFLDTNIVCTLTGLLILCSGVTYVPDGGAIMTLNAFESSLGLGGRYVLVFIIVLFAVSTMISYSYYSLKCARYLLGERIGGLYVWVYLASLPAAAVLGQTVALGIIDTCFALMAVPTLTGALLLSPQVVRETRAYFARMALAEADESGRRAEARGNQAGSAP